MDRKTVFIVDDNSDFRSSIAWMLKGEGHETVEFGCAQKALNAMKATNNEALRKCCMLLDVRMPEITGPEFHDLINEASITLPIVYMTGHADVAMAVDAMRKGAVTFLEKPLDEPKLLDALDRAFEFYDQRERNSIPYNDYTPEFSQKLQQLTPRESEVLDGIVNGQANKVIAYELGISVRTVEVHRARLMKKLGTRSASELMKMALTCQQIA